MQQSRILATIFSGLCVSLAICFAADYGLQYLMCDNSGDWMTTSGQIVRCELQPVPVKFQLPVGPEIDTHRSINRQTVCYAYRVDGVDYQSERLAFGEFAPVRFLPVDIVNLVKEYPVGKKVEVFYNPLDHEYSVLQRRMQKQGTSQLGVAVSLIVLGLGSFFSPRL